MYHAATGRDFGALRRKAPAPAAPDPGRKELAPQAPAPQHAPAPDASISRANHRTSTTQAHPASLQPRKTTPTLQSQVAPQLSATRMKWRLMEHCPWYPPCCEAQPSTNIAISESDFVRPPAVTALAPCVVNTTDASGAREKNCPNAWYDLLCWLQTNGGCSPSCQGDLSAPERPPLHAPTLKVVSYVMLSPTKRGAKTISCRQAGDIARALSTRSCKCRKSARIGDT